MYALRESETLNYLLQWYSVGVISAPTGHVAGTLIVMTWGKGTAVLLHLTGRGQGCCWTPFGMLKAAHTTSPVPKCQWR